MRQLIGVSQFATNLGASGAFTWNSPSGHWARQLTTHGAAELRYHNFTGQADVVST